ncbi:Ankyrin repeat domain-containing protein 50 [Colletotrichum fructicola]|nr:Ankyrin repeat domain-containing protein 50 [Colletotrichum fructicola]
MILDRNAYTIGWICALSVESAAAQVFLDDRHELPNDVSDSNSYVTGRIGKHNVVIAVMPQNEYGTATAATTAKDMVRSFPQMRLGLMVGIGGGAPSQEHDIRLGDVVVSSCGKGTGGVIQFDYGKAIQGQDFTETGHLNQPPPALLTAAAALDAKYDIEGPQLNAKVNKALEKQRKPFKKKYARPSDDADRLYQPGVIHPSGLFSNCAVTCGFRSDDLVHRPTRSDDDDNPTVHYGLIASSNQVMKDAVKRNKFIQRGVLCFEMEAAGLMNHFPCLVVRGICDYADTHKNSVWQPYAAMVAAAYAKDLLGLVNITAVEGERKLSDLILSVASIQTEQHDILKDMRSAVDSIESQQRTMNIKNWLRPAEPSDNAKHAKDLRFEKAGTWFLNSPAFQGWLEDEYRHLCLYGAGGCGKTVLTSTILDFLRENRTGVILYFFFDFSDDKKRNLDGLLRSLIFQLYAIKEASDQKVDDLRKSYDNGKDSPTTDDLSQCLKDVLETFQEIIILMDALDECKEENEPQDELIRWILEMGSAPSLKHVKIITTARPEAAFKKWLDPELADAKCVALAKQGIKADIELYIKGYLEQRPGFHTQAPNHPLVKWIPERLIQKADGMFRYAACQIDDIVSCLGPEDIEHVLRSLPDTIQETYKRSIERIPPKYHAKAVRILQFLVNAHRPLQIAEAVDIVSVRSDFRIFTATDRICPEDIVRLCPNLLSIVGGKTSDLSPRKELHLAHLSVKEYLLRYESPAFTFVGIDASVSIARTCLSYLLSMVPKEKEDLSKQTPYMGMRKSEQKADHEMLFPFAELASAMWIQQAPAAEGSSKAVSAIADQLQNDFQKHPFWCTQGAETDHHDFSEYASYVHFTCYSNLPEITKTLAARGVDINHQPKERMSPIEIAAHMNHVEVVRVLLDLGVSPDTKGGGRSYGSAFRCSYSGYFGSALQEAAHAGFYEIIAALLKHGAKVNAKGGPHGHALQAAAEGNHRHTLKLLLDHGADPNASSNTAYGSALQAAVQLRRANSVKTLLDGGADVHAKGGAGGHALQAAIEVNDNNIITLLLDGAADSNAPSENTYGSALQTAFQLYHRHIIKILVGRGAKINAEDEAYEHTLTTGVSWGDEDVVGLLLEKGGNSDAEDIAYGYVLQAAVKEGQKGIVGLLLEKGAGSRDQRNTYWRALKASAQASHEDVVRLLLERGANGDTEGEIYGFYDTALQVAAKKGHGDIVKIFLDKSAAADDGIMETALYTAAARGNQDLVTLLRDNGANVHTQGGSFEGALCAAVAGGHHRIIEILLHTGANVNASQSQLGNFLAMACMRESPEVMRYLLEHGADANDHIPGLGNIIYRFIKRHDSWSAGRKIILEILLEAGAEIQPNTSSRYNSLRLAVERGTLEPVRLLLSYGADPNISFDASQPHSNHSLLMESLLKSQTEIAQELLRFEADPNMKTSRRLPNQTALHLAMDGDFEEVVRLLLQSFFCKKGRILMSRAAFLLSLHCISLLREVPSSTCAYF